MQPLLSIVLAAASLAANLACVAALDLRRDINEHAQNQAVVENLLAADVAELQKLLGTKHDDAKIVMDQAVLRLPGDVEPVAAVPPIFLGAAPAAPEKPVAAAPEKPVAAAPEKPVAAAPGKPIAAAPEKPVTAAPEKPVAAAPEKPVDGATPAKPVGAAPVKPVVGAAPAKPVAAAPVRPVAAVPPKPLFNPLTLNGLVSPIVGMAVLGGVALVLLCCLGYCMWSCCFNFQYVEAVEPNDEGGDELHEVWVRSGDK